MMGCSGVIERFPSNSSAASSVVGAPKFLLLDVFNRNSNDLHVGGHRNSHLNRPEHIGVRVDFHGHSDE
jgi:hypothetical protein